ncbi:MULTISPECIES: MBG domain-containing protein [unclassified Sulfitobacter]|uniref:two-partner secretion domain-containing protein n=2 Tax=unclassified Sulfitobacter TaxID=196795 RepID=UPI0023E12800|nr:MULTISPECIES: MBG domain-containing protein [unclassified Sulfitobacter]
MMTSRTTTALASKDPSASKARRRFTRHALAFATALTPVWASAQDLPTGGTVVHGTATIATPGPNTMVINQGSDRAVVNWDGFSVGAGNRVDINQPNENSAILNRVTGDTTSQIHGQINANGRVFVVNPNGIFIGTTGAINTGSFVASTLGIRTDDFVTGQTVFEGDGASATVVNEGNIQVVTGGYAALIGGKVRNSGIIQAPLGFVGLGSGERITLDLAGDGFLQVAIPTNSDDDGLEALIENSGTIQANGGTVQISAATARNAARQAINMSGVIEARTVSGRNGRVTLGGGGGGRVKVTGNIRTKTRRPAIQVTQSARPALRPERGGDITITGRDITLEGASIDASGTGGGGNIRIGGNARGASGMMTAAQLSVDADTVIRADAQAQGNGGRIVLWSDQRTEFAGNISAQGGTLSGDGGFVEVSGKAVLRYSGFTDTRAENGAWGSLLLDPNDIFVVAALTGDDGDILASTVESNLAGGNVSLSTAGAGPDDGRIEINAPLSWSSGSVLSLNAETGVGAIVSNAIEINAPITAPNGTLRLTATEAPGASGPAPQVIETGANGDIDVGLFHIVEGDWLQLGTDFPGAGLPSFAADNFVLEEANFLRAISGDGAANPFLLTDVYGLQGIHGSFNFALANDIDASATTGWESLDPLTNGLRNSGFVPLSFTGNFEGNRNAITGMFIRQYPAAGGGDTGLFGTLGDNPSITNLSILDADVAGGRVGILAGSNGSFTSGVHVTGTVVSYGEAGGGISGVMPFGVLTNSSADVTVRDAVDPADINSNAAGVTSLGGLVGINDGDILNARSNGSVTLSVAEEGFAGGLVGQNEDILRNIYSEASVTAANTAPFAEATIGGLVGENRFDGTIENAIATGAVTLSPDCCGGFGLAGGLVGEDATSNESILSSFWNIETTGQTLSGQSGETTGTATGSGQFEGAFGETTASLRDAELFTQAALSGGWSFTTAWAIPQDGVDMARLYSVDPVITATDPSLPIPEFEYNGSTTGFSADASSTFSGGPTDYVFGPLGDTGDLSVMVDQIILSDANVGDVTFTFPTSYTSDLGQVFDVRSFPKDATVVAAPLSITINPTTKVYGEELSLEGIDFTADTLHGTDTITGADIISDGAPATADAATYALNIENLTGTGLSNYTLTITPGTLEVTPAPLTLTADDQSKSPGTVFTFTGTEFTVEGLVNDDTVTSATLTSDAAAADAPITGEGPAAAIFITDPQGTGLANYEITLVNGVFVVAPGNLVITALDQTKVYGSTFTFNGTEFSVTGLAEGDSVDSVTLTSAGADGSAQVGDGPFTITASNAVGTGLDQYTLVFADGSFAVTPAPLTVTALDQFKQPDQPFTFTGTEFTTTGLFNDDAITSVTLTSDGASPEATVEGSPYTIELSNVTGTGLDNYTVSTANGSFVVQNLIAPPTVTPPTGGSRTIFNPRDIITIALPGRDPTGDIQSAGRGGRPAQTLQKAEEVAEFVDTVSTELELQIQSCGSADQDFDRYMTCLSDSLDTYSNALDEIVNDLPKGLETVSATIRTAADEIRASAARAQRRLAGATTDAQRRAIRRQAVTEAIGAISTAKSEIRKAISLIRAEDPEVTAVQRRTGARIVQAFDTVETSMVRAVEL